MKQLYAIRHGDHNWSELTDYGIAQIRSLHQKIEPRLPQDARYKLVASPEERTYDTCDIFRQLFKKKFGLELPIEEESMFYPRGNGTYDASIEYGKKVIPMIEGYFKEHDIVFVMSHKESIGAMSLAIPAHYKIPFSDTLQPCIKPPDDEVFIEMCMDEYDLGRNKTIDKMIDDYPDIFLYTPSIPEASAAFFDIEAKVCELTRCGLRSMS